MFTVSRKAEHIKFVLEKDVQFKSKTAGFEDIELTYYSLPELSKNEISLKTCFLGKDLNAPLMVAGMTGGFKGAEKINKDIAEACQNLGIGFGVGSQRAMLENPDLASTYNVRDVAPDIFVAGNIGVAQLKDYSVQQLQESLETIGANALAIHSNAAQEAIQPEGTTDFSEAISLIDSVSKELKVPVYVKEVGSGISKEVAEKLSKTGIKAIDVGGAGGTSWTAIEYLRAGIKECPYWDFGLPTSKSIIESRESFNGKIIATGGIRSGLDVVKALFLGADIAGIAYPVLKAHNKNGKKGVEDYLLRITEEIRTGMFLHSFKSVEEIKRN